MSYKNKMKIRKIEKKGNKMWWGCKIRKIKKNLKYSVIKN